MTSVFVSYNSKDNYFVDFLVELLKFHHIDVWVDRNDLHAGVTFTSEIEHALASADNLLVVVSQHSSSSQWVTREISTFKAINPDRAVIPLVLDAEADVDQIYEGLGLVQYIRCYEGLLECFRELLRQLGYTLFPTVERRSIPDRRSDDRRDGEDRRTGPIERRLRVGIWNSYSNRTGIGQFDQLLSGDVGRLARFLASDESPLKSFDFVDRQTGEQVHLSFETLQAMAFASWESYLNEDLARTVYIIDDIVKRLVDAYVITSKDRRQRERRQRERRRET